MQLWNIGYSKKAIFASAMFLVLTLLIVMVPLTVAHSGDTMYAPPLTVPATIDGIWGGGEWSDAPQYTMVGNQTSYIRAKYNSSHLLVIIDSPWDTTNATWFYHENVWLAFDTAHDNGGVPQWDDYLVHATTSWTSMGWQGNGTSWNNGTWLGWAGIFLCVQAGENPAWPSPMQPSPNSATPHRISEMAVPLTLVGPPNSIVGFYAQVDDDSTDPDGAGFMFSATDYSEWPPLSGGSPGWPGPYGLPSAPCAAPSAWGNLVLRAPSVGGTVLAVDKLSLLAPYIALVSMIAIAGATAIYFIRRKKKTL